MAVYKNKASQKLAVFAYDPTDGSPVTGDAANITAQISIDGGATAATNDVNPAELDATDAPGIYLFDLTQAESNADLVVVTPVSSTADVLLEPAIIYTQPETRAASGNWNTVTPLDAAGIRTAVGLGAANLDTQIGDIPTNAELTVRTLAAADYATDAGVNVLSGKADTAQLDLDLLTGTDGATLATAQGNYAPAKAGDAMALTAGERTTLTTAIWNALTSGMSTAGSIGKRIVDYLTGDSYARLGAPAGASVSADVAAVKAETALIVADTNELQQDWADGGRLDLILDSAAAGSSPSAIADAVWDEAMDGAVDARTAIKRLLAWGCGRITVSGDVYTYYAADGTTALFTLTTAAAERTFEVSP